MTNWKLAEALQNAENKLWSSNKTANKKNHNDVVVSACMIRIDDVILFCSAGRL